MQDRLLWGMLVAVGLGVAAWAGWAQFRQPDHLTTVAHFQLVERSGRTITNADLLGKVWIAGCTFTCCTQSCPKINEAMARLSHDLRDTSVCLVNFSVDAEHDTPAVLSQYANTL